MAVLSKVDIKVELNTVSIKFDKDINTLCTEIDKFWVGVEGTYDEKTLGNGFYFKDLKLGTEYKFRLRFTGKDGSRVESQVYSFKTEREIIPTAPTDVTITIDPMEKTSVTIKFKKGQGVRTEIDAFWVNGKNSWDSYTLKDGFYFEDLEFGTEYKFKLRSVGNNNNYAETEIYSFKTEERQVPSSPYNIEIEDDQEEYGTFHIKYSAGNGMYTEMIKLWEKEPKWEMVQSPITIKGINPKKKCKFKLRTVANDKSTAESEEQILEAAERIIATRPTDVKIDVDGNKVTISFKKGNGLRTEIKFEDTDKWEYTTDEGFVFENLEWGKTYTFKLRTVSNYGSMVETDDYFFIIKEKVKATAPTGVNVTTKPNTAIITFNKGKGLKTEIDKFWINGEGTWDDSTEYAEFELNDLKPNFEYKFKLRTVGEIENDYAETMMYSFTVPELVTPTDPRDVTAKVYGNTVYIKFTKGRGGKTGLDKNWVKGKGTIEEYTTDNGFIIEGLKPGEYTATLYSINTEDEKSSGVDVEFEVYDSSKLDNNGEPVLQSPTAPSNFKVVAEGRCVTITYDMGIGIYTEIDKSWVEGEWEEKTRVPKLYYENLEPGTEYSIKFRNVNSKDEKSSEVVLNFSTLSDRGGTGEYVNVSVVLPEQFECEYEEKWFYSVRSGKPVGVTGDIRGKFNKYSVLYSGNQNEKKVYLTFDEGYEVGNTLKIIDILNRNDVTGTFFVTSNYMKNNQDIMRKLKESRHHVGNHTKDHPAIANVVRHSVQKFQEQLQHPAQYYKNLTGGEMIKAFRPPMGKYSELALKYVSAAGYKTVLWSFGYQDFDINNQKDPEEVLERALDSLANGTIYLLHAVSTTNTAILEALIKAIRKEGYEIGDLKELIDKK